jgi:hypothetical protein
VSRRPDGFVSLSALRGHVMDPAAALDEIRRIYFDTTKRTIEADFAQAIELLKALPSDELREKATAFMHGLSEMRREWQPRRAGAAKGAADTKPPSTTTLTNRRTRRRAT